MTDVLHPNRIPGSEAAVAYEGKFLDYLLNENHPKGRSKAKLFRSLGWNESNWEDLRRQFLNQASQVEGRCKRTNDLGNENWEAKVSLTTPEGRSVTMSTYWEVHPDEGTKLISAYPA